MKQRESDKNKLERLNTVIREASGSARSSFYRDIWKNQRFPDFEQLEELRMLPMISRADLQSCPLLKRIYVEEKLYVKIAYADNAKPLFVARALNDLEEEDVSYQGTRPLVLFGNGHETLEKSLLLYLRNLLPLIGEKNVEITAMNAAQYEIDGIVTDMESLQTLVPYAQRYGAADNVRELIIVARAFDPPFARAHYPDARVSLLLALPETGIIARSCSYRLERETVVFHPAATMHVECEQENLVATSLLLLPTPIIRYQTGIPVRPIASACHCRAESSFILL